MSDVRKRGEVIRNFLLRTIGDNHAPISVSELCKKASDEFCITKSAVAKHLKNLEMEGAISCEKGAGRSKNCSLKKLEVKEFIYTISGSGCLDEMEVYLRDISPLLSGMCASAKEILSYGFTEMFNNVMDHSGATNAKVVVVNRAVDTTVFIIDNGVGIFKKVKDALNLSDERQSLLELSKGKVTTDPANHSGEGIFFTSRACDVFAIVSDDLIFTHTESAAHDLLSKMNEPEKFSGTCVVMSIKNHSSKRLKKIFDEFSTVDDGFSSTRVPVKLLQYKDEGLISRSQAKRLLARVERFKFVTLDFEGIQSIGQAFADQIFRIFRRDHPEVRLSYVNACLDIKKAIKVAQANS